MKKLKFTEQVEADKVALAFGPGKVGKPLRGVKAGSVDEITANYYVQYLTAGERIAFVNDCYRVLKPGGRLVCIVPIWSAHKAYQDLAVQWPPVAEGWFAMLNKGAREAQPIKQTGYTCDFEFAIGYGMHQAIISRNQEYQQHAIQFWKEAAQDVHVTLTKR